jgi:hypothetical protein
MVIQSGKITSFLVTMFAFLTAYFYLWRAKKTGEAPPIRRIAGLDAIQEGVERAVEMGRPVYFIPGESAVSGERGTQTMAALSILGYTARISAQLGARFISSVQQPQLVSVVEEVITDSYRGEGKEEELILDVRYFPAYGVQIPIMGLLHQEKPAAFYQLGGYSSCPILQSETGQIIGAYMIGASPDLTILPCFISTCDYCLLGEELYAAGSYVSGDPERLATISGQDAVKFLIMFILIIGALLPQLITEVINT